HGQWAAGSRDRLEGHDGLAGWRLHEARAGTRLRPRGEPASDRHPAALGDNVPLRVDDRERDATRAAREHELLRSDALLDLLLHGAQSLGAGLARVLLEGSAYAMHEERGRQR